MSKPLKKPKRLPVEKHISKKAFSAIGLLMAMCSGGDMIISNHLLRMISRRSTMDHAYPMVTGMEIKLKINMIRIFLSMYGIDKERAISKLLDRIYALYERRNDFAHALLLPGRTKDEVKIQVLRAKVKTGVMPQPQYIKIETIRGYSSDLWIELSKLAEALTEAGVPTSQELQQIDQLIRQFVYGTNPDTRSADKIRQLIAQVLLDGKTSERA